MSLGWPLFKSLLPRKLWSFSASGKWLPPSDRNKPYCFEINFMAKVNTDGSFPILLNIREIFTWMITRINNHHSCLYIWTICFLKINSVCYSSLCWHSWRINHAKCNRSFGPESKTEVLLFEILSFVIGWLQLLLQKLIREYLSWGCP